ncbi:MAG TPA: hypothetical protein VL172_20200, partial [Kofleriaceae bacterium]|nr:hypothetical protein [Kofleriaceae bacterium]
MTPRGARLVGAIALASAIAAIGCGASGEAPPDAPPADAGVDAAPPIDGSTAELGDSCTRHADCVDGWCVEPPGGGGGVCSRECNDDCPTGWSCREVLLPDNTVNLCIPDVEHHCSRCTEDSECPGGACLELDGEGRCGAACTSTDECPTGYTCALDPKAEHTGMFCQPVTGSCSCNQDMDGATRTCATTNAIGTCWGEQLCTAGVGWSACSAAIPATEQCNGQDDDCDFVIDDGVGGGDPCTNTVVGVGSCPGVNTCNGAAGFACQGPIPAAESCNFIDDNCNGAVDEAFPTLGTLCSTGTGACTGYGAWTCNGAGDGVACSAVAGTPIAEKCNHIDDDCDTPVSLVDEDFPDLNQPCPKGEGVCKRYGNKICKADGSGTVCSASPGPATGPDTDCNYLDDDCDGQTDDLYTDPVTGIYVADTACGSCEIDCTMLYSGYPHAFGDCVTSPSLGCTLGCDPTYYNLDAAAPDGCEFQLETTAIYVSGSDPLASDTDPNCGLAPSQTGAGIPCKTITHGLDRAVSTGRAKVLVADGTYNESVTLRNNKQLLGGYHPDTWERHVDSTATVIQGSSIAATIHRRTVLASGITQPSLFEGFVVRGPFNNLVDAATQRGGNSYAIYVFSSNSNLTITHNVIVAGRAASGGSGTAGQAGDPGTGGGGRSDNPSFYDSTTASGSGQCNTGGANTRMLANGGDRTCGGENVGGGDGGYITCPTSSAASTGAYSELSAHDATAGKAGVAAGDGTGGTCNGGTDGATCDGGNDGYLYNSGNSCVLPPTTSPVFGINGRNGTSGTDASAPGAGCSTPVPSSAAASGHWILPVPGTGATGAHGGGGSGGGAGGGGYCASCTMPSGKDRLGGHGGGGGSGGCGGKGGLGGGGGGGVFGIF